MNIAKHIALYGTMAFTSMVSPAQTHITFDTEDYRTLSVYDTWGDSPFRTGELNGNVQVLDNHLANEETNASTKILGVQRSRFGSNTFGAKIDLKETFDLTPTQRFVHVMIHKPVDGRVMLIGLGKRADRPEQSNDVEQFWSYPINEVKTGEWCDAVFPIKGNGGIDIYSLVVVPHCEAPHDLSDDFVAYIDDILIDDNLSPRIGLEDYSPNFTWETPHGRPSDRWTSSVGLSGTADGSQTINIPTTPSKMAYNKLFETPLKAKAGETVTPVFGYTSGWMHTYVYIDRDNDGQFSAAVDDNIILDSTCDLMAFSLYTNGNDSYGKNSAGTTINSANNGFDRSSIPNFTIPANLSNGIYRMRYKVDWNNIDAGGDLNSFTSNGGIIVDVLLNIHGDYCNVTNDNRNGEVLTATGETLNGYRAPFGQALKIKMVPSNGFTYNGIRIRHGYNLSGDSLVHGNPQFRDEIIYADEFDANDCVSIPAEYMDGDVLIEGLFVEEGSDSGRVKVTYDVVCDNRVVASKTVRVTKGAEWPNPEFASEASSEYFTLSSKPEGTCEKDTVITLTLKQNLPFKSSVDFENAHWHYLSITASKNYLSHSGGSSINIGATTTAIPDESNLNSQWAFIGDVINGFQIVNRGAGDGKILSSSHDTESNTGGSTYPIMTETPVPSTHNTYWMPTKSTNISGENGFYLHQLGHTSNRMNSRDSKLAYWTGGADGGSTFIATLLSGYAVTIVAPSATVGTLEVYCDGERISNGTHVDEGSIITIMATPNEYYNVTEITVNGVVIEPVDGIYTYTVGTQAITVAATFERDPDAPIDYCIPTYGGTGTSRTTTNKTDRYLRSLTITDGVSSITTESYGSTAGRAVYKDETSKILTTEPGKTITISVDASMWAMHDYVYVDFDNNGFDLNDRVIYPETLNGVFLNTLTFTVPANQAPGTYRVRHMIDWDNSDPCQFAQTQSSDNGEAITDFLIRIEADQLSIITDGEGEVEIWSEGNASDGPTGIQYRDGDVLPSDGIAPKIFAKPANEWKLYSLIYDNGNGTATDCTSMAENVSSSVANYSGWLFASLERNEGSPTISVVFSNDTSAIDAIVFDPNDGPVEYFNLQGVKIETSKLNPGFYIARQGEKVVKILVK